MKKLVAVILMLVLVMMTSAIAEEHIYDNAVIEEQKNATGTIGTYSVIEIAEDDLTWDDVEDWYFNYVKVNENACSYYLICFANSDKGVYTNGSYVEYNATLAADSSFGNIMLASSEGATDYIEKDGHLVEW